MLADQGRLDLDELAPAFEDLLQLRGFKHAAELSPVVVNERGKETTVAKDERGRAERAEVPALGGGEPADHRGAVGDGFGHVEFADVTISSAPWELMLRPRYSPTVVLVEVAQAVLPLSRTFIGPLSRETDVPLPMPDSPEFARLVEPYLLRNEAVHCLQEEKYPKGRSHRSKNKPFSRQPHNLLLLLPNNFPFRAIEPCFPTYPVQLL